MLQNRVNKIYYSHILWVLFALIYLIYQIFETGLISPKLKEILHGAEIISGGGLPYIDFKTMISPGIFYINSLFYDNILFIKLISGLNIILISACIYYLSRKVINKEYAIYPSILSIILISVANPWGTAWLFALLFILISAIFIFKYLENNTEIKYVFYSGLMLGLASLFRHEMAGFIFGAIFQAVFFMSLSHRKADLMQKNEKMVYGLKNALVLALGLTPVLPFTIYLLIKIPIKTLWNQLFISPFTVFRTDGNIPFPNLFNFDVFNIFDLWFGIIFYSTLIMIIFLVYYLVKNVKSKIIKLNGTKFWQLLMIFNVCLNLFNIPMIASDYWHFLPILICGNIILFIYISEINNKLVNKIMKTITLTFILSVILLPINN